MSFRRMKQEDEYEDSGSDEEDAPQFNDESDAEDEEDASENEAAAEDLTEEEQLRKKISSMPLSKVRELKEKLGVKLFNKTYFGEAAEGPSSSSQTTKSAPKATEKSAPKKRESQKKPREISSKAPVSRFRPAVEVAKKHKFDPRFSEKAGEFDEIQFNRDYGFLNELKDKEIKDLKKARRSARAEDPTEAERIKTAIRRLENQKRSAEEAEMMRETRAELRKENIERMNQGRKPVYLNNKELKKRFLEKKFERIRDQGKLESYMQRKERRLAKKAKM
ncbi:Protein T22H9.1 [Aphelenchoides avenae]|nr:Protein T22H9.1 [Aphelenchus avenae]